MSKDMKLIMERFEKAMNEQFPGIGLPLKTGVATAAGKAEKEMEDKKTSAQAHNFHFLLRLQSMGDEPEFIEIEPGDIMGIELQELKELLNKEVTLRGRADQEIPARYRYYDGPDAMDRFEISPEGNLISVHYEAEDKPRKIPPSRLQRLLQKVLKDKGLWAKFYLARPDRR